jgi:glycosyltransferase involved in cell wall biosynthesis
MKIAQIVCVFPPYNGGIGHSAKRFSDILENDHEITTFTLKQKGDLKDETNVKRLNPLIRFGHAGVPFSLLFSLRKFDCIYFHYPFFGASEIVWLFLLFNKKTKLIIHYHMDTNNLAWYLKILAYPSSLIRNSLFKRADKIVSASLDYLEHSQIAEFAKNNPDKIKEVPFGLDTDKFAPKLPEKENQLIAKTKEIIHYITKNIIKRGQVNLLFVGGLDSAHYFKGLDVLLIAASELKNKNWVLKIIGSGNLQETYQKKSEALGFSNKVKFLGKVDETTLIKSYQESDIFILPSINKHEAFGLVLTEAMACGVPVIASELPGVRSVFRNGLDGLTAKVNDSQDLASKIDELIGDERKRLAMGKSARAYALKKYSWEAVSNKLKSVFS